jgi:hypothetical protein
VFTSSFNPHCGRVSFNKIRALPWPVERNDDHQLHALSDGQVFLDFLATQPLQFIASLEEVIVAPIIG